jgi:hypothetical protein
VAMAAEASEWLELCELCIFLKTVKRLSSCLRRVCAGPGVVGTGAELTTERLMVARVKRIVRRCMLFCGCLGVCLFVFD